VLWGQSGRLTIYLQLSVKKTKNLEYCISDRIIFMDNGHDSGHANLLYLYFVSEMPGCKLN
jgi:hypothetical protein